MKKPPKYWVCKPKDEIEFNNIYDYLCKTYGNWHCDIDPDNIKDFKYYLGYSDDFELNMDHGCACYSYQEDFDNNPKIINYKDFEYYFLKIEPNVVNMKTITITEEQAKQMFESGIESLKSIAETNYPELFKKKIEWKDFGEVSGYHINNYCGIDKLDQYFTGNHNYLRSIFPTKEEAEACLALSQLCQWRDKYNANWQPNWSDSSQKDTISFKNYKIFSDWSITHQRILAFKTAEIRDKFLEDHSELIQIAKPLL